jgi:hypothetical protein
MDSLNDDALLLLLGKVLDAEAEMHATSSYSRTWARRTLPLVSRRLNGLLKGPNSVYEHLVIDPACEGLFERRCRSARDDSPSPRGDRSSPTLSRRSPPGPAVSPEAITRWLRARSNSLVKSLSINSPGFNFTRRELEQIFGLLKRSLRRLHWTGSSLSEHELYECLGQLKQLEELRVCKASETFLDALSGGLAFLPKLRQLDFSLDLLPNFPSRARDVPRHLTRLAMANVWLSELPRALAGLERLASLELCGCRVDADPLPLCCSLPSLRQLHASELETQPAETRFGPSGSITSLRLSSCGLQQVRRRRPRPRRPPPHVPPTPMRPARTPPARSPPPTPRPRPTPRRCAPASCNWPRCARWTSATTRAWAPAHARACPQRCRSWRRWRRWTCRAAAWQQCRRWCTACRTCRRSTCR